MGINHNFFKLGQCWEENKKMTFSSVQSLGFPSHDVLDYDESSSDVKLGFVGLTGVDSPLPYYLISQNLNLLNNINHKLYVFFYLAIKKSRNNDFYDEIIKSSFRPSRENLIKQLKSTLGEIDLAIQEFIPVWMRSEHKQNQLGEIALGEIVLGEKVLSTTSQIIVELGPVSFEQAQYYRNHQTSQRLQDTIRQSTESHITFKLKCIIHPRCEDRVVIGQWIMH